MAEKILKKSMREHKRYILLEGRISKKDVEQAILDYIGILGFAKASPKFVNRAILAINRESINEIRGALCLGGFGIKKVSGTLKGLRV